MRQRTVLILLVIVVLLSACSKYGEDNTIDMDVSELTNENSSLPTVNYSNSFDEYDQINNNIVNRGLISSMNTTYYYNSKQNAYSLIEKQGDMETVIGSTATHLYRKDQLLFFTVQTDEYPSEHYILYCYNIDSKETKILVNNCLMVRYAENSIFYLTENGVFCMSYNGTKKKEIIESKILLWEYWAFTADSTKLYLSINDELKIYDFDGNLIDEKRVHNACYLYKYKNFIYYRSNYAFLYRLDLKTDECKTVSEYGADGVNFYNDHMFIIREYLQNENDTDPGSLYMTDLNGKNEVKIKNYYVQTIMVMNNELFVSTPAGSIFRLDSNGELLETFE